MSNVLYAKDLLLFRENNEAVSHFDLLGYRTTESVTWIRRIGRNMRDPEDRGSLFLKNFEIQVPDYIVL